MQRAAQCFYSLRAFREGVGDYPYTAVLYRNILPYPEGVWELYITYHPYFSLRDAVLDLQGRKFGMAAPDREERVLLCRTADLLTADAEACALCVLDSPDDTKKLQKIGEEPHP